MINVNLIAPREQAIRFAETAGRAAFFVAVGAFIFTMVVITWQQTKLRSSRAGIVTTRAEVGKLRGQKSEIDTVDRRLDSQRPLVELLRSGRDSEGKWCQALANLSEALPGVTLLSARSSKSLRPRIKEEGSKPGTALDREGFTLVGQASSGNMVGQFITNLQNTPSFKEVYLQYTRKRGGGVVAETVDFEIQAFLPGKGGAKP